MSYRVTLYRADLSVAAPKHYLARSQAIHAMRKLAYSQLEAFGKLDTQAAHDVMAAIARCDDILPPQAQRTVTISNTGYSITLANTASTRR